MTAPTLTAEDRGVTLQPGASKIAYDEAVRTLTAQASVLDNLRSRATAVVTVATLVTSILGGQVLVKASLGTGGKVIDRLSFSGWLALGSMLLAVAGAVAILWPYEWRFDQSAEGIISDMTTNSTSVDDSYRLLAIQHDRNHTSNSGNLDRLFWVLRWAFVALAVETVAWIWQIRG